MAHHRTSPYYQDSHDDYASSSSSHRQLHHSHYLPNGNMDLRGRPAYTTVRPFVINRRDNPVSCSHLTVDQDLNRHVGDYVADRIIPTMLRSSDRPVGVFMNLGDTKLARALPEDHRRLDHGSRARYRGPNAIVYSTSGCSLTLDGQRCERYCSNCDVPDRDLGNRVRHHLDRELDQEPDDRHHYHRSDKNGRSRSHIRITSYSRDPSPSPLPLSGLFPIATTAVENAKHAASHALPRVSHSLCPGCQIETTLYRDGYCVDCPPPRYTSDSRQVAATPAVVEHSRGTRARYIRDEVMDGSTSDDSRVRVDGSSRADRDRRRTRGRSSERVQVYDNLPSDRGYVNARRRSRSRWEKERRSMTPRYSGYVSESDW